MTGSSSQPRVPEHLLDLAGRFFDAGWTHADVLYALNHSPDGSPVWGDPMRWEVARARLRLWMDGALQPVLSRSQQVARGNAARMRAQALARMEWEEARRRASPDPEAAAARARAMVARVLPAAAEPLTERASKVGSRADRERWRRLDEVAAATVESGSVMEAWEPDPEPEPEADLREVARRRALARARWERASRSAARQTPPGSLDSGP